MRRSRAAVLLTLALAAACSSACSSEESLNPQPLPPEDQEGTRSPTPGGAAGDSANLGACNGTCCSKPAEGSACDSVADTTCSWAVTCPTGLVIPYEVTCTNGVWQQTNGCPAEGTTDERGCPAKQPENGTTCQVTQTSSQCGYVLECTGYRKSAIAQCFNNGSNANGQPTWQTTPLGVCD
jgi:hypothetical protein